MKTLSEITTEQNRMAALTDREWAEETKAMLDGLGTKADREKVIKMMISWNARVPSFFRHWEMYTEADSAASCNACASRLFTTLLTRVNLILTESVQPVEEPTVSPTVKARERVVKPTKKK